MAKKKGTSRRVPRSSTPRTFSGSVPAGNVSELTAKTNGTTNHENGIAAHVNRSSVRSSASLAAEYHYVIHDLRWLGILAVGTSAILVVLGLVFG